MYSLPYILYIIFLFLLSFKYNNIRERKLITAVIIISYGIFFGLRGFIGSDFRMYYSLFDNMEKLNTDSLSDDMMLSSEIEIGFLYYVSIFKHFVNDYSFYILLNSLINICIILHCLKRYSVNIAFALIVFLEIGGMIFEIDVQRNMKALLLFMLSLKYLENRSILPYMLLNLIGLLFHSSALIYIGLYWVLHRKYKLKYFWLVYLIGNVLFLLKIPIITAILSPILEQLGGRYLILASNYLETGVLSDYGFTVGFLIRLLGAILVTKYYDRLLQYDSRMLVHINCIFIYLLIFVYFSEIRMLTLRFSNLFFFSYAIIIPTIYKLIEGNRLKQYFLYCVLLIAILKVNGKVNSPIYEYDMVIFNHKSPIERSNIINDFYMTLE